MVNSADPDETAHYKPSHLDLHCLQSYLYWSAGIKGLTSESGFYVLASVLRKFHIKYKMKVESFLFYTISPLH